MYPLDYQAKSTGYFLVLVPLIAFCIRCIVGAFHTGVFRDTRQQTLDKSRSHDGPRGMRWKYALSDIEDPKLDPGSSIESNASTLMCFLYHLLLPLILQSSKYVKLWTLCINKAGIWCTPKSPVFWRFCWVHQFQSDDFKPQASTILIATYGECWGESHI